MLRLVVVLLVLVGVALAARCYRSWRAKVESERPEHPRLPDTVLAGAARTWIVFSTPFCASCGPAEDRLRKADPGARVVRIDATADRALARAFAVRSAPTVLLADADGRVQARLVGASAVESYVGLRPA